jgi:hypothetical protein
MIGKYDASSASREGSHTSPCVTSEDERQHPPGAVSPLSPTPNYAAHVIAAHQGAGYGYGCGRVANLVFGEHDG